MDWARGWSRGRPVLYVAGNHEFYGHAIPGLIDELRRAAAGSSVRVLENDEVVLDGVRFLGCTLWSDFDFDGPERRGEAMQLCERVVNDYEHITFGPSGRTLAARDTRMLHLSSRRWLAVRLAQPHHGPTVIVTHHAPLIRTRPPQAALRALAGAFASDVTSLMGADRVALWIFGHTHRVADLEIRGLFRPYGKEVAIDFTLPASVVETYLGVSPDDLLDFAAVGRLGTIQAGALGANAHFANGLAADLYRLRPECERYFLRCNYSSDKKPAAIKTNAADNY